MVRHLALLIAIHVSTVAWGGIAVADTASCVKVADDFLSIDGMIDDWKTIKTRWVGKNPKDAAYRLGCAYDDERLYLVVDVRDQRLLRYRSGEQDEIRISLGSPSSTQLIRVSPGTRGFDTRIAVGNSKKTPKWIEVVDSLQSNGFSVELSVELTHVSGYGPSAPGITASIQFVDVDQGHKVANRIGFSGLLYVGSGLANYRAFMKAAQLSNADIRLDKMANVDGRSGNERVLAGNTVIGVLGDSFSFMKLPVSSAADVLAVKVVDLSGDGTSFVVAHYRQHGNGGSREVVAVYQAAGGGTFPRLLAFEVAKTMGENRIVNKWSLVKKGTRRKLAKGEGRRGFDILVEAQPEQGWDEDSYQESPAMDVNPILLPWLDETAVVYHFDGNVSTRSPAR